MLGLSGPFTRPCSFRITGAWMLQSRASHTPGTPASPAPPGWPIGPGYPRGPMGPLVPFFGWPGCPGKPVKKAIIKRWITTVVWLSQLHLHHSFVSDGVVIFHSHHCDIYIYLMFSVLCFRIQGSSCLIPTFRAWELHPNLVWCTSHLHDLLDTTSHLHFSSDHPPHPAAIAPTSEALVSVDSWQPRARVTKHPFGALLA